MSTDFEEHLLRFNARFEAMELAQKTFRDDIMRDMRELVARVSAVEESMDAKLEVIEERLEEAEKEIELISDLKKDLISNVASESMVPVPISENIRSPNSKAVQEMKKSPESSIPHKFTRVRYSYEPIGSSLFFIDAFLYHVHDPGPLILFSSTRKSRVPNFGEFSSLRESAG
jgi:hypothetical protein